jgi:hypothetical protein
MVTSGRGSFMAGGCGGGVFATGASAIIARRRAVHDASRVTAVVHV